MNEAIDALRRRRSVRRYDGTPVGEDALRTVLEIGLTAPKGRNLSTRRAPSTKSIKMASLLSTSLAFKRGVDIMNINVTNAPKTATFQMRINPEVKKEVESIYANCGMTLTDAFNAFLQQTINVGGMPFIVNQNSAEVLKQQAIALLMAELKAGEDSVKTDADWISEEAMLSEFGE